MSQRVGSSTSLSTSPARSTNNMLIVRSICACARNVAVMLDDAHRASWGWVLSSSSGATTMMGSGVIGVAVGVDSGVAVGVSLSIITTSAEGAGGGVGISGGGVVVLGGGVASSASRCRIRSIAAVIAASSDW